MPIFPEAHIEPPATEPVPYGLVETARAVEDDARWQAGVTFAPDCAEATAWSMACEAEGREKPGPGPNLPPVVSEPFEVVLPFRCSSYGFEAADYEGRTRRIFEAAEQKAIEHEFWTGSAGSPSLMTTTPVSSDHILNPGTADNPTAVSLARGMVLLAQALASCGAGARGMIHMTAGVGELAFQKSLIEKAEINGQDVRVNGRGDLVVVGTGYTGWGPIAPEDPEDDPAEPEAPADGTSWIYATRLVNVRKDEIRVIPETMAEALDRRTNTVTFYAESLAMAYDDGCCRFAVLVESEPA